MRIHCVGDVMVDVVVRPTGPLAFGSDTPGAVRLTGGGSAANTAAWVASLGVPVAFTGRVGDDVAGRSALAALSEIGVDCNVAVDDELATGACLVLVDDLGERTMVPDPGANAAWPGLVVADDDHLHVSAYALFHDPVRERLATAIRDQVDAGRPVSLDLASAAPLRRFDRSTIRSWCRSTTVFANLAEARVVTGTAHGPAAAVELVRHGAAAAVVKGSADGAWVASADTGSRALHVPVPDVVVPVDTVGAGDAFAAGFLAATSRGASVLAATQDGHRVAATALTVVGGRPVRDRFRRRTGGRRGPAVSDG